MNTIIAAIDIKTTGLDPLHHDIIEIAILPLAASSSLGRTFRRSLPVSRQGDRKTPARRQWR